MTEKEIRDALKGYGATDVRVYFRVAPNPFEKFMVNCIVRFNLTNAYEARFWDIEPRHWEVWMRNRSVVNSNSTPSDYSKAREIEQELNRIEGLT